MANKRAEPLFQHRIAGPLDADDGTYDVCIQVRDLAPIHFRHLIRVLELSAQAITTAGDGDAEYRSWLSAHPSPEPGEAG